MNAPRSSADCLKLYDASLKPARPLWRKALSAVWIGGGLCSLMAIAWAEPWSARFLDAAVAAGLPRALADYLLMPLVMALRGVLLVESFGYVYHRFFQHLGRLTRLSAVFRRNQMFHWVHHMIIYPIGRFYKQALPYVASETGIAWSWTFPALAAAAAAVTQRGFNFPTVCFLASIGVYAKFVIDVTHSRFHEAEHPWSKAPYFHRLEDIHLLHHWDQRYNFTIVHPAMDALFGTYLSPDKHRRELAAAKDEGELTVSDLINWRYLLIEATPAEYAAFISQAWRHPRSLRKVDLLIEVYGRVASERPAENTAAELMRRCRDLQGAVSAERRRALAAVPA